MIGPQNQIERLQLAGTIAPSFRAGYWTASRRRVIRVRGEEVVGIGTLADLWQGLLRAKRLELELENGPPKEAPCDQCLRITRWYHEFRSAVLCDRCWTERRDQRDRCIDLGRDWDQAQSVQDLELLASIEEQWLALVGSPMFPRAPSIPVCCGKTPARPARVAGKQSWRCRSCASRAAVAALREKGHAFFGRRDALKTPPGGPL